MPRDATSPCRVRSADGEDEQPRKPQHYLAVETRLVGCRELLAISGEELLAHWRIKRRQIRLQRRALEPLDNGLRVGERMIVGDVPDIEPRAHRPQNVVILLR